MTQAAAVADFDIVSRATEPGALVFEVMDHVQWTLRNSPPLPVLYSSTLRVFSVFGEPVFPYTLFCLCENATQRWLLISECETEVTES